MNSASKSDRIRFKRKFALEMIDRSERRIEHHKSMIRNFKADIKTLNRETI